QSTDSAERALLEHAQELRLKAQFEFSDFIQENCAAFGLLEEPFLASLGVGESAFFVSEELALHEGRRNCCAVYRDKRSVAAAGSVVDCLGYEVLDRGRLALEQDRRDFALGDFAGQREHFAHSGGGPDDLIEPKFPLSLATDGAHFFSKQLCLDSVADRYLEFFEFDGLADEVIGASPESGDGVFDEYVGGNHYDDCVGMTAFDLAQHVQTGAVGQNYIQQNRRRLLVLKRLKPLCD